MAMTIVITNQKGGVGKTTTAGIVAGGLAGIGYRVLAIDMDPQGNLSFCLGAEIDESPTVYELLKGQCIPSRVIQTQGGIDVIPSNILLSGAELEFSKSGREFLLRRSLSTVTHRYDVVVIDTPPALNLLTVNAYTAADRIIIPMSPEVLSLLGISQLRETIEYVQKIYNPTVKVSGILLNKYDRRRLLTREVEEMARHIARELHSKVFNTKIRSAVALAEAPAHGQTIYDYAPKSNVTLDCKNFIKELIQEKGMEFHGKKK